MTTYKGMEKKYYKCLQCNVEGLDGPFGGCITEREYYVDEDIVQKVRAPRRCGDGRYVKWVEISEKEYKELGG